ncbi:MAG: hypothetical protein IJH50_00305 [Kiritimatiellae bacterium]|nr:hypothetical protein [Kiritimatiellia bacterium]
MTIKKTMSVFAAALLAATAFAQEEEKETTEAAASATDEAAVPKAAAPAAVFTTLPYCRLAEGTAEVLRSGSSEWAQIEEGRFYPLGSAYRTKQGGKLVLAFGVDSTATISGESSFGTRLQPVGEQTRGIVLAYGTVELALANNLREGAFFVTAPGFTVKNPAGESKFVYESVGDGDKATVRCVTGSLAIDGQHFSIPAMRAADEVIIRTSHDHLVTFLYGTSGDYVVRLDQGVRARDDVGEDGQIVSKVEKKTTDWHLSPKTKVIINRCLPSIGERMSVHTMAFDAAGERQSECYFCEGRAEINSGELVTKDKLSAEELARHAAETTTETSADADESDSGSSDAGSDNDNNNGNDGSDTEAE